MQLFISVVYHLMVAYFTFIMFRNLFKTKDVQLTILYFVVLMPFVMRILRLK